jgi:WhiB family redox-sensing transcriptional regulator
MPQRISSLDTTDPEWWNQAACREMGDELFFDPYDEPRSAQLRRISLAKTICGQCAVQARCREYALQQGEPYGIWGGLSEHERARLLGVRTLRYAGVNRQRHLTVTAQPPD